MAEDPEAESQNSENGDRGRSLGPKKFGSGGSEGGLGMFFVGLGLSVVSLYLFFDSVRVVAGRGGWVSGMLHGGRGGLMETTSMGIIFVPFFLGVFALFTNAKQRWAWWLTGIGIAIIGVEILSRIRFFMDGKLTHLMLMFVLLAAGCGLMFRSYRDITRGIEDGKNSQ